MNLTFNPRLSQLSWRRLSPSQKIGVCIGLLASLVCVILIFALRSQIVKFFQPAATALLNARFGTLIIIVLLALSSIPPLCGQDFLMFIAGFVWGNFSGFLLVFLGSLIGECIAFLLFRKHASQFVDRMRERYADTYGVFESIIEEGGYAMIFFIRMTIIPAHFTTALFATMRSIEFRYWLACSALASWKAFIPVYLGNAYRRGRTSTLGDVFFVFAIMATLLTGAHIYQKYRDAVIERRIASAGSQLESRIDGNRQSSERDFTIDHESRNNNVYRPNNNIDDEDEDEDEDYVIANNDSENKNVRISYELEDAYDSKLIYQVKQRDSKEKEDEFDIV